MNIKVNTGNNENDGISNSNIASFSFISDTTIGTPVVGVKLIHKIAKENKIPVSWVVNVQTGIHLKQIFDEFHSEDGDDLIFKLQSVDPLYDNPGMEEYQRNIERLDSVEKYRQLILEQKKKLRELFPWSEFNIASLSIRNDFYVQALKEEGFTGLWGMCIGYKKIRGIDDEGVPIGFFKIGSNYKIPLRKNSTENFDLIGINKTFCDLNKSFHSKKPTVYNLNTLDIQKRHICEPGDVRYWKNLVDHYLSNLKYNRFLPIVQQQPAHEMEHTMGNNSTRLPKEIEDASKILNEFFGYIKNHPQIRAQTLNASVKQFNSLNRDLNSDILTPNYILADDIIVPSKYYHIELRKPANIRKYHVNRLKYYLKKVVKKTTYKDIPERFPKNGKTFPPLFIFQNSSVQLYFHYIPIKKIIQRPIKQYIYGNQGLVKRRFYPIINYYKITKNENGLEIEIHIKCKDEIPWGILISGKYSNIEVKHDDKMIENLCMEYSKCFPEFSFIYTPLINGINKFIISANLDKNAPNPLEEISIYR